MVRALATLGRVDIAFIDRGWIRQVPDEAYPLAGESVTFSAGTPAGGTGDEEGYPSDVAEVCRQFGAELRDWVRGRDYDLIWCNRINTWAPLRGELRAPLVIDVDDLNDRLNAQNFAFTRRAVYAQDALRWSRLQRAAAQEADQVVVCSEVDRQRLGQPPTCRIVPNVYLAATDDIDAVPTDGPGPRLLLQGSFVWPPNVDAAHQLVREILPLVRAEVPEVQVWLVGMNLGAIDDLAADDVRVFGLVPDVRAYVRAADIVTVPLRQGSGTRIKLLESFSLGTPVVSTAVGADGIDARHGEHLLLADSPHDFAGAVLSLLRNPETARQMAGNAQAMVVREYGLAVLLRSVDEVVQTALAGFATRRQCETPVPSPAHHMPA